MRYCKVGYAMALIITGAINKVLNVPLFLSNAGLNIEKLNLSREELYDLIW